MNIDAETTRAFSVPLRDEPGSLGAIAERLGKEGINLRGYAVATPSDGLGSAFFVTDDPEGTPDALRHAGHDVDEIGAVLVTTANHPGRLARLATTLAQASIDIDASFVTANGDGSGLECVFAVDAPDDALAALERMTDR